MGCLLNATFLTFKTLVWCISQAEIIRVGVVTIDRSSIGIKFEEFMQAGCKMDLGMHRVVTKAH